MTISAALSFLGMLTSLVGAWFVGDARPAVRFAGFVLFAVANIAGVLVGFGIGNVPLILQNALFVVTSARGLWVNRGRA